jgi:hypothetical protein
VAQLNERCDAGSEAEHEVFDQIAAALRIEERREGYLVEEALRDEYQSRPITIDRGP